MGMAQYIAGMGFSNVGLGIVHSMVKKYFDTIIDEEAKNYETIIFSAGKIGYQVELNLEDLKSYKNSII